MGGHIFFQNLEGDSVILKKIITPTQSKIINCPWSFLRSKSICIPICTVMSSGDNLCTSAYCLILFNITLSDKYDVIMHSIIKVVCTFLKFAMDILHESRISLQVSSRFIQTTLQCLNLLVSLFQSLNKKLYVY